MNKTQPHLPANHCSLGDYSKNKMAFMAAIFMSFVIFNGQSLSMEEEDIRTEVKKTYAKLAQSKTSGCSCNRVSEESTQEIPEKDYAIKLGYYEKDLEEAPLGSNLGLGCGNPSAIANLKEGETVIDLGCGSGFDCFLAARKVGETGRIIGVDMTSEMIDLAKKNASKKGYKNVEFLLGTIEDLPISNSVADVIISNCVVNLSPDKEKVFKEAARVLKTGGRLAISDVIATTEVPEHIRKDLALFTGCMAGATQIDKLKNIMEGAGFGNIQIDPKEESRSYIKHWAPESKAEDYVASAYIYATKIK